MVNYIWLAKIIGTGLLVIGVLSYIYSAYDSWHNEPIRVCNNTIAINDTVNSEKRIILEEVIKQSGEKLSDCRVELKKIKEEHRITELNYFFDTIEKEESIERNISSDDFNISKYYI